MKGDTIETHESYGMIGINRYQSTGDVMFASSMKHRNGINLNIYRAEHRRSDSSADWYHATEPLICIRLSQSQFAELITTPNVGSGVPCTIEHVGGNKMADPPFRHTAKKHRDEFAAYTQTIADGHGRYMVEAMDILKNKSTISKGDRETIISAFELILQDLQSNLPFLHEQFHRQMDKTIVEAKSEIEAFVEHKVRSVGLEAIRDQMPQLTGEVDSTVKGCDETETP